MASLLVKSLDASLLREVNYAASKAELTQRDFVIRTLAREVGWEARDGGRDAGDSAREAKRVVGEIKAPGMGDRVGQYEVGEPKERKGGSGFGVGETEQGFEPAASEGSEVDDYEGCSTVEIDVDGNELRRCVCGKRMLDMGNSWHCKGCGRNFLK